MTSLATLSISGRIATLTLRRADARNSLSPELLAALHERLGEIERAPEITVVVLTGEGRAFCAGMDLKLVLADPKAPLALLSSLADLCVRIRRLPAVVLASVNGAAIGGGCGLATVCDLAITHADAKLGFPEVDLGVCPAVVAPWLVRKIGSGPARSVLLRGGTMSGQQAFEVGIVDEAVATREALEARTGEIAARLATGGAGALRATKALLNELDGSLDAELSRKGAELSARVLATPEAQEMLRAKLGGG